MPGVDVEAGAGPAGALLDEFAGAAGHVLVGADPRVDHHPVAQPADLHGEVGVLAVHPDREAAGYRYRAAPQGGEGARDDHDPVHQALAEPGEPELEGRLQHPHPVEPGDGVGARFLHGAHAADLRILEPGHGVDERVLAEHAVGVHPDDDLGAR